VFLGLELSLFSVFIFLGAALLLIAIVHMIAYFSALWRGKPAEGVLTSLFISGGFIMFLIFVLFLFVMSRG